MKSDLAKPFDDIPDEVAEQIFKRVPLWSWKELAKVDKRFRHLVQVLKPEITVIEGFDLENLMDFCVTAKKRNKYDCWTELFPYKLVELISNFPNVIGVKSNNDVEAEVEKMCNNNLAWKYLGKKCPNLKFLFLNYEQQGQYEIDHSVQEMSKICLTYIEGVMEEHPDADPCCDQIIEIEQVNSVELVKKYQKLSFKLCAQIFKEFLISEPFIHRLVMVSTLLMDIDEVVPMINVKRLIIDIFFQACVHQNPEHSFERLEFECLKKKMPSLFPNVTSVGFYTKWITLTECLDFLDYESKIVKAVFGIEYPLTDDHVLQLHRLASRHNSSLKMIDLNNFNIYVSDGGFIVESNFFLPKCVDEVMKLFPSMPLPEILPSTDEEIGEMITNWFRDVIDRNGHL